jgi:hypothetical protein
MYDSELGLAKPYKESEYQPKEGDVKFDLSGRVQYHWTGGNWVEVHESDPNGKSDKEPGSKLDAGKAPVMRGVIRYFPRALEVIARISEKGAKKYSWKGWESVPGGQERYADARGRHELAIGRGEVYDTSPGGTGELHLGQVSWNALAELELYLRDTNK